MQIVIPLFDRFAPLDAVGPYQILKLLPDAEIVFAAARPGPVADEDGAFAQLAQAAFDDVPHPDVILVPGGGGQADHMTDGPLRDWLIAADKTSTWTTSVCTGALILAGAGLLTGREATTYWLAMDELARLGARPRQERYVFDGKYVTAAGVSAGIDMALALAMRITDAETARRFQLAIEYDPRPPFDGDPYTAPPALAASVRDASRFASRPRSHSGA